MASAEEESLDDHNNMDLEVEENDILDENNIMTLKEDLSKYFTGNVCLFSFI